MKKRGGSAGRGGDLGRAGGGRSPRAGRKRLLRIFGEGGPGEGSAPRGKRGRLSGRAGAGLKEPSRNRRVCAYNQFITAEHMASISPGVSRRGGKQTARAM